MHTTVFRYTHDSATLQSVKRERVQVVIVGAGAAGLMAAIWAGRALAGTKHRILLLDGARSVGVKSS
jgi:predicted flavoprotein YhiN